MDPLAPMDGRQMAGVDPDLWMQEIQTKAADLAAKSAQLQVDMTQASATVMSKDHAVRVTIAPTGALQDIQLTDHAARLSPLRLQASIMEAVGRGQRAASEKMMEAFAPLGAGTESMDLVLSYLPPAVEDEAEDSRYGYDDDGYAVEDRRPAAPQPPRHVQPARRPAVEDEDEDGQPW
ncbi:YbaB/EbfC family nucleoid-associated protein [Lentzea sp. NPDC059081]|uniref:YbaB/EbfC family nucleoid-associated protein n=1 Tax=Lentzea sp. NPDC059081 TaxID=3346719 RepID=UPI00368AEB7E